MEHQKDILGEQALDAITKDCIEDEEERFAKFLARFAVKPEIEEAI